ncbi:MAG: ATP-binding protein [Lentisphaeraceae bacterium]|nr:ATP-binding protein [Lentisphaeraceae bacterium]
MDHGIEENDIREANGKGVGEILLDFKETEQGFIVEVSDNGQGIDYEGLAKKAVLKGIITEKDLFLFTKDEKINLIFEPGFSSKENVTDISGRGVGMDVVKTSIEAEGGNIEIETSIGIGTTIRMCIPKNTIIREE